MPDPDSYLMPNQGAEHNPESVIPDGQAVVSLGNLLNVLAPSPTDGQVLTFVASSGKWQAVTPAGGVSTPLLLTGTDVNTIPLKVVGAAEQVQPVFEATNGVAGRALALGADGTAEITAALSVVGGPDNSTAGVFAVTVNPANLADPAISPLTVLGSTSQTADILSVQDDSDVSFLGVGPSGDVKCGLADGSAGGVVIYDSGGVAWRLVVAPTTGALTTVAV